MFVLSGVEGYVVRLEVNQALGILIFLGMLKIAADIWRNKLMGDNSAALQVLATAAGNLATALKLDATAQTDAANALRDLASKLPADISEQVLAIAKTIQDSADSTTQGANALEDVVRSVGEPTTQA